MEQIYIPKQRYKVLVRCITYNQHQYIEDTLNGFVSQNTSFPFVCVVIDDHSTDGEQDVIKAWIERECDMSRAEFVELELSHVIIVPHKINNNCAFAFYLLKKNLWRERSLKETLVTPWRDSAEYEAFCEGDDYWTDCQKLSKQSKFLDDNKGYSAIAGQSKVIYEGNVRQSHLFSPQTKSKKYARGTLIGFRQFHTASIMHRRYTALDNRPMSVYSGDICLIGALSILGDIYYSSNIVCVYRKQPSGASSTVELKDLKNDQLMVSFFCELDSNFNTGRILAYLNYTYAFNPIIEPYLTRMKFAFKSFILSFRYFPKNYYILYKILQNSVYYTLKQIKN